jgi:uncharacterized protein with NAD-binding domain and iron-sulfur cluster
MNNKPTIIIGAGPAGLTAAHELGRQSAAAIVLDSSTDMGGLSRTVSYYPIGRNGLHRYNNQDHSMLTGLYAAQNILGGPHQDVWSVNTEQSYHEEAEPGSDSLYGDRLTPVKRFD